MNKSKSILCSLGDQKIDESIFKQIIDVIRLKVTDKYDYPPVVIKCKGSIIGTIGNFSATVGKPKSKKTYNVTAEVSAALSGKPILNYEVTLPPDKQKILYVDTEQGRYHCHKVLQRIMKLAGLPLDKDCARIEFLVLREFTPEQRRDIISHYLSEDPEIGLLIIDGVRDLVKDINNSTEALEVMNDLMRWSSYYNLHLQTVLHLNKGDDNTRGHIGTELNNKAETVLQITKCRDQPNMSEVRVMHIRDKEFQPFAFYINQEGLPELVNNYDAPSKSTKVSFVQWEDEQHRTAIEMAIGENKPLGYTEMLETLTKGYTQYGYARGRCTMVSLMKELIKRKLIIKNGKNYIYNDDHSDDDTSD